MSAEGTSPGTVVSAWHDAVNAGDVEGAVALCAPEVEVRGPRGTGHGQELVRAWLTRSGIRLEPQHALHEVDGRILVTEKAQWTTTTDAPAQAPTEAPVDTWVVFRASGGVVTSIARFETEADALEWVASPH